MKKHIIVDSDIYWIQTVQSYSCRYGMWGYKFTILTRVHFNITLNAGMSLAHEQIRFTVHRLSSRYIPKVKTDILHYTTAYLAVGADEMTIQKWNTNSSGLRNLMQRGYPDQEASGGKFPWSNLRLVRNLHCLLEDPS